MNTKNTLIILAFTLATLLAVIIGGYLSLGPYMFLAGLAAAIGLSLWAAQSMDTRDLLILTVLTTVVAFLDEWTHTSSGAFNYYDGLTPSPLTVFGWSLFILGILTVSKIIMSRVNLESLDSGFLRMLPLLFSVVCIVVSVMAQDYLSVFNWTMILLYLLHTALSLIYTRDRVFSWNLWVMITSIVFGGVMEVMGAIEGMWIYQEGLVPIFMVFTWALRTWTILTICSIFNVDPS